MTSSSPDWMASRDAAEAQLGLQSRESSAGAAGRTSCGRSERSCRHLPCLWSPQISNLNYCLPPNAPQKDPRAPPRETFLALNSSREANPLLFPVKTMRRGTDLCLIHSVPETTSFQEPERTFAGSRQLFPRDTAWQLHSPHPCQGGFEPARGCFALGQVGGHPPRPRTQTPWGQREQPGQLLNCSAWLLNARTAVPLHHGLCLYTTAPCSSHHWCKASVNPDRSPR